MDRVAGMAWAPPGRGTVVVVTADGPELKLTAGTWYLDEHAADTCRALARQAHSAYDAFDALRQGRRVYMRRWLPGVWHARAVALTRYAPTRADGTPLPRAAELEAAGPRRRRRGRARVGAVPHLPRRLP